MLHTNKRKDRVESRVAFLFSNYERIIIANCTDDNTDDNIFGCCPKQYEALWMSCLQLSIEFNALTTTEVMRSS